MRRPRADRLFRQMQPCQPRIWNSRRSIPALESKAVVQSLVKQTLQAFLEREPEENLGHQRHAAGATYNSRNGDFEPKRVAKRQTSSGNFSEGVIRFIARYEHVQDLQCEISSQFVSCLTEQLRQQITDWQTA